MVQETLLDVRQLAPPEPLEMALKAVGGLTPGKYLCLHHRREPCGLLPRLNNLDCDYWIAQDEDGFCEVYIWRKGDGECVRAIESKAGRSMEK